MPAPPPSLALSLTLALSTLVWSQVLLVGLASAVAQPVATTAPHASAAAPRNATPTARDASTPLTQTPAEARAAREVARGEALLARGRRGPAERAFTRALALDSASVAALRGLSDVLLGDMGAVPAVPDAATRRRADRVSAALNEASAPLILPIGVRAPATMYEPAMMDSLS